NLGEARIGMSNPSSRLFSGATARSGIHVIAIPLRGERYFTAAATLALSEAAFTSSPQPQPHPPLSMDLLFPTSCVTSFATAGSLRLAWIQERLAIMTLLPTAGLQSLSDTIARAPPINRTGGLVRARGAKTWLVPDRASAAFLSGCD